MWLRYSRVMEATAPLILCLKSVASESSWGTYKRSFIKSPKEKISISGKLGCHRKQGLSSSRCWPIQNLEKTFNQSLTELCQSANVLHFAYPNFSYILEMSVNIKHIIFPCIKTKGKKSRMRMEYKGWRRFIDDRGIWNAVVKISKSKWIVATKKDNCIENSKKL